MDWYKHFAVRFLAATAYMSLAQRGAYITLLDHQWDRGGFLPKDEHQVIRMVGIASDAEADVVRFVLTEKFQLGKQGYYNRRMLATIREARRIVKARRDSGRKGGLAKARNLPAVSQPTRASYFLYVCTSEGTFKEIRTSDVATTSVAVGAELAIAPGVELPEALRQPAFVEKWSEWLDYRRTDRGKKVSKRAAKMQLKKLAAVGVLIAVAAIDDAIANDYQGVFPEKLSRGNARPAGEDRERAMKPGDEDGWT